MIYIYTRNPQQTLHPAPSAPAGWTACPEALVNPCVRWSNSGVSQVVGGRGGPACTEDEAFPQDEPDVPGSECCGAAGMRHLCHALL